MPVKRVPSKCLLSHFSQLDMRDVDGAEASCNDEVSTMHVLVEVRAQVFGGRVSGNAAY